MYYRLRVVLGGALRAPLRLLAPSHTQAQEKGYGKCRNWRVSPRVPAVRPAAQTPSDRKASSMLSLPRGRSQGVGERLNVPTAGGHGGVGRKADGDEDAALVSAGSGGFRAVSWSGAVRRSRLQCALRATEPV